MGLFDAPQTTSTTSPYPGAAGALNGGLKDALSLYKKKQLNPYTPLSPYTKNALSSMTWQSNVNRKPLNQALQRFTGFANGAGDIGTAMQDNIYKTAMGPSMSEQNLAGIARGDLIGQEDENYNRLRQRAQENAATEAGMVASGMGRSGSDYHQTAVARQVGDTTAGMDYQRLQDERARQVEANTLIDQMRQAGYGIGLNAANSSTAIQTGNQDRRFNANAAIPGAADAAMNNYAGALSAGRALDVDRAAKAGAPGANLSSLMQLLGIASPYGTTTQTEPSNAAGGMAGAGLGLASLLFG